MQTGSIIYEVQGIQRVFAAYLSELYSRVTLYHLASLPINLPISPAKSAAKSVYLE